MRTEPISVGYLNFRNERNENKSQNVSTPERILEPPKIDKFPLLTAAVAITSLGVSAIALSRGNKKGADNGVEALKSEIERLQKELANKTSSKEITSNLEKLSERINNLENSGLKNELLGKINSLKEAIGGIERAQTYVTTTPKFFTEVVNVNGKNMRLGTVFNPLMDKNALIEKAEKEAREHGRAIRPDEIKACEIKAQIRQEYISTLQTEATKRLLGIGNKQMEKFDHGVIRIPTSEFKGFASTGGMSAVPREIADNLAKLIAEKQRNISIVADIPLYRGAVESNRYNNLIENSDGTFNYIQTEIKKNKEGLVTEKNTTLMGILKKVGSMDVPIMTDTKQSMEHVDLYMHERVMNLNYGTVEQYLDPEFKLKVEALGNNQSIEFGSLVISRDKKGALKAGAKVRTLLYDNGKGGKFDLNVAANRTTNIYNTEAISSAETERFVYFSKFFYENIARNEETRVLHRNEANTIAAKIEKAKTEIKNLKDRGRLTLEQENERWKAITKLEKAQNDAFAEAEKPLGADLIIGNDWQSGPISAMMRQLTTSRKYYGSNPVVADKLYNTPIVTVMHNAGLAGGSWHSQEKLLNILFGEHAAAITRHSHMPNLAITGKTGGLEAHSFNGLMENDGVNPQMMAVAYSDFIVPVSEGYSKEIATQGVFGGARQKLFEFRAREGEYADIENLRLIANQSGINPNLVKHANPTMIGITNGSDRANNTLTATVARNMENHLDLPSGTFVPYETGMDYLEWHNKNKMEAIRKMQHDISEAKKEGAVNVMKIEMLNETDLSGVTEKTPVFVSAGRIVDQKGLDILGKAMQAFYKDFKGGEIPVFYIQGIGDAQYKEAILEAKREIAKTNPEAAKRIVFAELFSEPGRYDLAKLVTDFSLMPSWFEPCGLSHKEIGQFSGAGAVVNRTGGLTSELIENLNVISADFNPDRSKIADNGENFAGAIRKAIEMHSDNDKYRKVVESMMTANFDWAREGGPIFSYADIFKSLGVDIGKNAA